MFSHTHTSWGWKFSLTIDSWFQHECSSPGRKEATHDSYKLWASCLLIMVSSNTIIMHRSYHGRDWEIMSGMCTNNSLDFSVQWCAPINCIIAITSFSPSSIAAPNLHPLDNLQRLLSMWPRKNIFHIQTSYLLSCNPNE